MAQDSPDPPGDAGNVVPRQQESVGENDGALKNNGRAFWRAMSSQVQKEAQDFLLLTPESQNNLDERRLVVLSRRYKFKDSPKQPRPLPTKEPVINIAIDGLKKLKNKTQQLLNDPSKKESCESSKSVRAQIHTSGPPLTALNARNHTDEDQCLDVSAALSSLLPPSQQDETDSMRPHPRGRQYIFQRGTAPENLQYSRQKSLTQSLKKFLPNERMTAIEYRPIFTYYVTATQFLILVLSICIYGLAPIGFTTRHLNKSLLVTSLTNEVVQIEEAQNMWIGSRIEDLIKLGARFTPCMRDDPGIRSERLNDIRRERDTACCVRHDRSGCVQLQRELCSENLSTWRQITYRGHAVNSVCGLDPRYCEEPASINPYEWPDDITQWPKCIRQQPNSPIRNGDITADENAHMGCQVVGRPCCLGSYGQCEITTQEYCKFARGTFHEEAALCSQVSCLGDACGMFPFIKSPDRPDQFYRPFISLFLHAGILHFIITLFIQMRWMRELEKIYGPHRIGFIYMFAGSGGNLASAIFVPYRADVGPSAAIFGVLALHIRDVYRIWPQIEESDRFKSVLWTIVPLFIGLLCGLTPWTDNYGHLTGLLLGFLCTLFPYNREKKRILCGATLLWTICSVGSWVGLWVWLYYFPGFQCSFCQHFTCIWSIFKDACETHSVNYKPIMKHKL